MSNITHSSSCIYEVRRSGHLIGIINVLFVSAFLNVHLLGQLRRDVIIHSLAWRFLWDCFRETKSEAGRFS